MGYIEKVNSDIYFVEQPIREGWFVGVSIVIGKKRLD